VPPREFREAILKMSPMPEIAVTEDGHTTPGEDKIGATGQSNVMEAIAKATAPALSAENKLATRARFPASASCC
jgi:hypothetical protein